MTCSYRCGTELLVAEPKAGAPTSRDPRLVEGPLPLEASEPWEDAPTSPQ